MIIFSLLNIIENLYFNFEHIGQRARKARVGTCASFVYYPDKGRGKEENIHFESSQHHKHPHGWMYCSLMPETKGVPSHHRSLTP